MTRKTPAPPPGGGDGGREPPKHSRFVKGRSGNPKGRPKGSKNLATIIAAAARDQVTATIDGQPRNISKLQATAMQMATQAAGGKPQMVARFLEWIDEIEHRAAAARPPEPPLSEADLEVIRAVHARMQLCKPKEKQDDAVQDDAGDHPR